MKAIIFARISHASQEENHSIPSQVRRLTEYALKKNFTIAQTCQIVESSSKTTRKQFDEIIQLIKKSKESYVLITDTVDRLQRSFRETPLLDELRKQGKLELHFLREGLIVNKDSNSAQLLQWDIGVLFASSYVRQHSDNIKRSQEQCIKSGQLISKAPYAYENKTLSLEQKDVVINPEQAAYVIRLFEEYAQGNVSFHSLALKMKAEGFPLTSRGKSISDRTVEVILKNPFYMGMMKTKGQLLPHRYPTLISEELFNKVQDVINKHRKSPVQHVGKEFLFKGLITCKNCNGAVTGDIKKKKYVYYVCHNSRKICTKKWVKEEVLLAGILHYFDRMQITDNEIKEIVAFIKKEENKEQEFFVNKQRILSGQLNITQDRISKLIDMHIDGKIDADIYHSKLDQYKKEQQKLTSDIKACSIDNKNEIVCAQEVLEITKDAKNIFMSSKLKEKQQLLSFFCSNLMLDVENLFVELKKPFDEIVNRGDQHIWWRRWESNPCPHYLSLQVLHVYSSNIHHLQPRRHSIVNKSVL